MSECERSAAALVPVGAETRSRIAGQPTLPPSLDWPWWQGEPMVFLAQVALEELPAGLASTLDLPDRGTLYFFSEHTGEVGNCSCEDGAARVLYTEEEPRIVTPFPGRLRNTAHYRRINVALERCRTPADNEYLEGILGRDIETDPEAQKLDELWSDYWHGEAHEPNMLRGFPCPIQTPLRYTCLMASRGFDMDEEDWPDSLVEEFWPEAPEWELLLQLFPWEERTGIPWAISSFMYFMIKKQDLLARRFEKAWMIHQYD